MKFISELPKNSDSKTILDWAFRIIGHNEVPRNTLKVLSTTLLSIGLISFCLGFYFKMYLTIGLPSFGLMAIAALISD